MSFLGLLVAAWIVTGGGLSAASPPAATPPAAAEAGSEPAPPPPALATRDELASVKTVTEGLAHRFEELKASLDGLSQRLDALPRPEPAPDLKPITTRLDSLTESLKTQGQQAEATVKTVADLQAELKVLGEAVARAEAGVKALQDEPSRKPAAAEVAPEAEAEKPKLADAGLARAVEFFRQRQFPQAVTEFRRLRESFPDDARVWYYSALSNGFATGNWEGETVQLATRGAELEKAGTPGKPVIDEALTGLTPQTAQWINAFRARAR